MKSPRNKTNRPDSYGDEDFRMVPKPGLNSNCHHIAQMFLGKDNDLATELTRHLRSPIARRLGIRRRAKRLAR